MSDELSDLRLFLRIVTAGSLSEAARRLHSSLPVISRRLASLEARLGVRLIDRGSRHFVVTEEGSLLFDRGTQVLAQLDELESEVSARVATPRGHIRVGAPAEIGRRQVGPLIAEFSERYPGVSVELMLSDALIDIQAGDLDVGLLTRLPSDGNMVARRLLASRRVVCASPTYLSRHGTPQRPQDLSSHNCIRLVRGRHIFDRWDFRDDLEITVTGSLLADNAEAVHCWALSGHGIAFKALWDVEEDLAEGRLIELLKPYESNAIDLYVTYPTRKHLPLRVRAFIDFLFERLG